MAQPLDGIIHALRSRNYLIRGHVWYNVVKDSTRPKPTAAIRSIAGNEPEIIEDYPHDHYGASCLILGLNGDGNMLHTVVGYEQRPIKIVTAYYPDPSKWINGRRRRQA